jgi:hypothetical protein
VVCQNTHVTGFRREVDLDTTNSLMSVFAISHCGIGRGLEGRTHPGTCRWTVDNQLAFGLQR